jgi:hypothetical protein
LLEINVARNAKWRNPNPSGQAQYSKPSTNIFLRLQNEPIKNYTAIPLKEIKFNKAIVAPALPDIQPMDSKYLIYFLTEVPELLGCERFFRSAIPTILEQSLNQPILRHTILALSSWFVDNRLGWTPLSSLQHHSCALPGIQNAITELKITSEHITSVTLLSWLSLISGDMQAAHRHLMGLFLMFTAVGHLTPEGIPGENPDPMFMFLYRIAIKIDNTLAYRNFSLVFPLITDHVHIHRQWLSHFVSNPKELEICLSAFKLDDLTNQLCHLHSEVREMQQTRNPAIFGSRIQESYSKMKTNLKAWRSSPTLQEYTPVLDVPAVQVSPQIPLESQIMQILHRSYYQVDDLVVAEMLMIYASLLIQLSISMEEKLGPFPESRIEAAIETCVIYASIGEAIETVKKTGESTMINALWLAGLVFEKKLFPTGTLSKTELI